MHALETQRHDAPMWWRGRLRQVRRACQIVAVAAAVWFPAGHVSAHASLQSSTPADGAVLAEAPSSMTLVFNEPVQPMQRGFRLVHAGSAGTSDVSVRVDGTGDVLTVHPTGKMPDGTWALQWQVESADGHLVAGVVRFHVGTAPYVPLPSQSVPSGTATDRVLELTAWVAFVLALAGAMLQKRAWVRSAVAVVVGAAALRVLGMFDRFGSAALDAAELPATVLVALAAVCLLVPVKSPRTTLAAALGCFAAQGVFTGHHLSEIYPTAAALAQPLHLAGAALWAAALVGIYAHEPFTERGSKYASAAIALLVPATAVLVISMWPEAWDRWEWTITLKVVLVVAALGIGWWNHRRLRTAPRRTLRRLVALELALLMVTAIASASIAATPPTALTEPVAETAAPSTEHVLDLTFDDGTRARVVFDSTEQGARVNAMMTFTDPANTPVLPEQAEWEISGGDVVGLSGTFFAMGDHVHALIDLPVAGTYLFVVHATLDTFSTVTGTAQLVVSPQPAVQP